jgi:putative membrane protein
MPAIHRLAWLGSAGLAVCLAGSACRPSARAERSPDDASYSDTGHTRMDRNRHHTDSLTDGDIAAIVSTANTLDSAGGAFALTRAQSASVRTFAQRMVRDHGAGNRQVAPLLRDLNPNTTPLENDDMRHMRNDAEHEKTSLAHDSGATFDKAYIDHEVDEHQHLLDKLDHDLIPHAQNARLKTLLASTRATVNTHLTEAKRIQDLLKNEHH